MADNYLERAMEDLQSGRYSAANPRTSGQKSYTRHIYIKDIREYGIDNVRMLVREGAKVTFSFPDGHEGSRLARTLKCHYRPIAMGIPDDAVESHPRL